MSAAGQIKPDVRKQFERYLKAGAGLTVATLHFKRERCKNMKDTELREMLKANTNMTDHDIEKHIKDGVIVYSSFEEFENECFAIGYDKDSELDQMVIKWTFDNKLDKMTYNGNTYYVDFIL